MYIKFAEIEIQKKIEDRRKYLICSFVLIPILGLILHPKPSSILSYIYTGLLVIDIVIIFLYRGLVKRYKVIGNIIINKDSISISGINYQFNDFIEIVIFYDGFKGESFPFARFGVNQIASKDGAGNKILLKMNSKENVLVNFLSTNKADLTNLKRVLKYYVDNGVNVKIERI